MSRSSNIKLGLFLLMLGLVLTGISYGRSVGASFSVFWGCALIGLYRLLTGLSQPRPVPSAAEFEQSLGSPSVAQIVGEPCARCETSIMVAGDGGFCEDCGLAVHRGCARDHLRMDHVKHTAPYR